jgi:hypothetical protein
MTPVLGTLAPQFSLVLLVTLQISMRYASTIALIGIVQIVFAAQAGVLGWILGWSGLSWILASLSYGPVGPRIFGKKPTGTLTPINVLVLLPYLLVTWGAWHTQRLTSREAVSHEIVPGLWLGRRCSRRKLPVGVGLIVDMTCEFAEPCGVVTAGKYICVPTPDGGTPNVTDMDRAVSTAATCGDSVYVHCAVGHGRSAMFVAALLLTKNLARTVPEAELLIKTKRIGVRLNPAQRQLLEAYSQASKFS